MSVRKIAVIAALAGLVASGTTRVTEVNYIDRGYERFEEKLLHLGAKISRK